VTAELSITFSPQKVRQFHWKPPFFSARRQAARSPTTDPHSRPARNPTFSLAYFGFHWLEFFLGSHLRLRMIAFRGGLVLIDRFYYDFFVDQRRYRLRVPVSIVRLGHFFLKKPDLVVLLEAAASGLPAVATDAGGVRECVADGETGFVVPRSDGDALAAAMSRLALLPAQTRARMAKAARALAVERFAMDTVMAEWERTYRELLERV